MLLSPGHSPRHLSSPSPSLNTDLYKQNPSSSSSNSQISSKSQGKQATVLDEDAYVASIEKIIERDFFPDIPKLRDRLDWLEAVRSGDPIQIRDAQLKIIERRGKKLARRESATESKHRETITPRSTYFRRNFSPFELDKTPTAVNFSENNDAGVVEESENSGAGQSVDPSLSLDEFFRRYTSEDNESFSKVLEKVNKKRKERYGHLLEGEKEDVISIEYGKMDRITDGYGTSDQPPHTLDSWKYTAKNLLMYHPADNGEVALTEAEKEVRIKGLSKEINRTNTRFHGKLLDSDGPNDEDTVAFLYTPVLGSTPVPISNRETDKLKRYDLEDLKKTPHPYYVELGKKAENGYNFVKTPSPAPGVDESPFITWGEIEGTPLRLETEDTPIGIGGSGNGRHFNIQHPPSRDIKAHSLSREAALKIRERSKMFMKPPLPTPSRGGSASPGGRILSSAAQKFVRNAIGKSSSSVDNALRASYRGSSPGVGTPKSGRSLSRFESPSISARSAKDASLPPW